MNNEKTGRTLNILVALIKRGKVVALKEFDNRGIKYQEKLWQYKNAGYEIEEYDLKTSVFHRAPVSENKLMSFLYWKYGKQRICGRLVADRKY